MQQQFEADWLRAIGHNEAQGTFPPGCYFDPPAVPYTHSWWIGTLPFVDQSVTYDQLDTTGSQGGLGTGWDDAVNNKALANLSMPYMHCPSSSLPTFSNFYGVNLGRPSYVGIAGSVASPTAGPFPSYGTSFDPGANSDINSTGGVLPYTGVATQVRWAKYGEHYRWFAATR